ncbi:hypothetical protein PR202_ga27987 [Eleusine coracana subsp. coracana]|uniref:Reverse transcriptase zinc-binding domain-containing protein n=1 Tax=Eleusine coracana subsp. coracana TaxID=191504 RepID=A0AAV5DHE9_ELECO|nr:hypothetical protein PR202_ga27987 [Eleusine coracana subsp. coracana]
MQKMIPLGGCSFGTGWKMHNLLDAGNMATGARRLRPCVGLKLAGYALQLRWLWLRRTDQNRAWGMLPLESEVEIQAMFDTSIEGEEELNSCTGNAEQAMDPRHHWVADDYGTTAIFGTLAADSRGAPAAWNAGCHLLAVDNLTAIHCQVCISNALHRIHRATGAKLLWKTWSPPKVKFFLYLALHNWTWTAERRFRHGLQDSDVCALCDQAPERVAHLLVHCPYVKEVWWEILSHINLPQRFQQLDGDLYTAWSNL